MSDNLFSQLIFASTLVLVVFAFFIVYFFVIQRMRMNRHYLEKQQLLLEMQHRELSLCFEERELTMTQVSKEVHDNIGQIAHLARMHLHVIESCAYDSYQLKLIKYVSELTDQLINHTHDISHSLNSDFIKERGLSRVLEDDLEQIRTASDMACFIHTEGDSHSLDPEKQLLVYRIAQEVIHNTLKHAKASLLEVNLDHTPKGFMIRIVDNGKGYNQEKIEGKGTMGLRNMKERAKLLNGNLSIKTAEGKGCIVTLTIDKAETPSSRPLKRN
ncbi:sensor histidine kinase [Parapedobacter sp. 10938]|uniref:sensor histidine kinase n=1 Tax=Parapedobacter flavus TaxID=3110225 RepID=UPI002DBC569C|nr:ATP-binding protein [Parapedobacter sp. 10938]MEC3880208.1 ATP-binding protein [Parapedobacter sp. 10938]